MRLLLAIIAATCLFGCNFFLDDIGGEGQPCSSNGTCQNDLICISATNTCANPEIDGDTESADDDNSVDGDNEPTDGDTPVICDEICVGRCLTVIDCDCGGCDDGQRCEDTLCVSDAECSSGEDCGSLRCAPLTECESPDGECGMEGYQTIQCLIPYCLNGVCRARSEETTDSCARETEGMECDFYGDNGGCHENVCWPEKEETMVDFTGVVAWQQNPPAVVLNWEDAQLWCDQLEWGRHDDWELPPIDVLRVAIANCNATDSGSVSTAGCAVSEDCSRTECMGENCAGCPDTSVTDAVSCYWDARFKGECGPYWSSTVVSDNTRHAWIVDFNSAAVTSVWKTEPLMVRCARFLVNSSGK